jgi:hypothetical protein
VLEHVDIRRKKDEDEWDMAYRAIKKVGYVNYQCQGCFDSAYKAFPVDENGNRIWDL